MIFLKPYTKGVKVQFAYIPTTKNSSRRFFMSIDVEAMQVCMALNDEGQAYPCLTAHFNGEGQFKFLRVIVSELSRNEIKPRIYLDRLSGYADIAFEFEFPFVGANSALIRKFVLHARDTLGVDDPATKVKIFGVAEFDYQTGSTGFGLLEFLQLYKETGFFIFALCDNQEPDVLSFCSPNFKIEALIPGSPELGQ